MQDYPSFEVFTAAFKAINKRNSHEFQITRTAIIFLLLSQIMTLITIAKMQQIDIWGKLSQMIPHIIGAILTLGALAAAINAIITFFQRLFGKKAPDNKLDL